MKIKNFAIIKGENTIISDGRINYSSNLRNDLDDKNFTSENSDDIRAKELFSEGILEFKVTFDSPKTSILLLWKEEDKILGSIGHSFRKGKFRIYYNSVDKLAGSLNNYILNQEVKVRIELFGSVAKLFINDILLIENPFIVKNAPIFLRIISKGKVSLFDFNIEVFKPKLFVVMQFSEDYNNLYNEVIKPVAEQEGFECIRGDEFFTNTPILTDIITSIRESKAIIAEITPDNPNVFYEIGYAHAINKPTILLCDKKREKLPFDISSFRTLFYVNTIAGKTAIETNLRKYLENIK